MYSSNLEPICCSVSCSNYCLLTCIQVCQAAGRMVWYFHVLKNFPQYVVIHMVKGFSVVNDAEVDVFLEFSCIFYDPMFVGNLISGSSAFSKYSLNIWKFSVHSWYCWSLAWRILSMILLSCEMSALCGSLSILWALPFFGIGMKTDLFQFYGHFWVFQICWYIEYSTFTASSFRIWNSSAEIHHLH